MRNQDADRSKDDKKSGGKGDVRGHGFGVVPAWNVHLPGDVIGRVLEGWHLGKAATFGGEEGRLAVFWGPPGVSALL